MKHLSLRWRLWTLAWTDHATDEHISRVQECSRVFLEVTTTSFTGKFDTGGVPCQWIHSVPGAQPVVSNGSHTPNRGVASLVSCVRPAQVPAPSSRPIQQHKDCLRDTGNSQFQMKTNAAVDAVQHANDNAGLDACMSFNEQKESPTSCTRVCLAGAPENRQQWATQDIQATTMLLGHDALHVPWEGPASDQKLPADVYRFEMPANRRYRTRLWACMSSPATRTAPCIRLSRTPEE